MKGPRRIELFLEGHAPEASTLGSISSDDRKDRDASRISSRGCLEYGILPNAVVDLVVWDPMRVQALVAANSGDANFAMSTSQRPLSHQPSPPLL
jgi:hypothetical protein